MHTSVQTERQSDRPATARLNPLFSHSCVWLSSSNPRINTDLLSSSFSDVPPVRSHYHAVRIVLRQVRGEERASTPLTLGILQLRGRAQHTTVQISYVVHSVIALTPYVKNK